jgi:hypothetical protein
MDRDVGVLREARANQSVMDSVSGNPEGYDEQDHADNNESK